MSDRSGPASASASASASAPAPASRSQTVDSQAEATNHAATTKPSQRQDNGYWYDSFPVYNAPLARGPNGRPAIISGASAAGGKPGGGRVLAPDLTRGLLMMIMAFDHAAVALHTWEHGTGWVTEADGQIVKKWNFTTAYIVRTLTHLCAPGFTFLMGMGVVYLGLSRTKLGWGPMRLSRYFAVRCVALTAVTVVFGFVMTAGQLWLMNAVLLALAVDYLLAGMLWLTINKTEDLLARLIVNARKSSGSSADDATTADSDDESITQPLLREREAMREARAPSYEANISWTIHNLLLLVLCGITISWNIWLSDDGGVCKSSVSATTKSPTNPFLRIWFWVMMEPGSHILSGFPPMAWLSFAILGMLYGRIMTARQWSRRTAALRHVFAAMCLSILFVLTRVLRFGNLSEGCVQTPDQDAHPGRNPYLASLASFFYIVKYPPDVAFFAFTMAGNLLVLAIFTAIPPRIGKRFTMLLDFGTSALFFYIVHMMVLFGLGSVFVALFGHETDVPDPMNPDNKKGIESVLAYFGFWALTMLLMWPLCRWYSRFKSRKSADSIWRFF